MDKRLIDNDHGVVLVMVLLILVATIILGIAVSRSAFFETKIAGNERTYKSDFYAAEASGDYILSNFDSIMSTKTVSLNSTVDLSTIVTALASYNPAFSSSSVTITLIRKNGTPPAGSGMGVGSVGCDYYVMHERKGNQDIEVGVWKAFPMQQQ